MSEDELQHLCRLATIAVFGLRDDGWVDYVRDASDTELRNQRTILCILGDAFVELARRQEMLPRFRVRAGSATASDTGTGGEQP